MRWLIFSLMLFCLCAFGCSASPGLQPSPDGGWNARDKSVPGERSNYGRLQGRDDDN